MRGRVIVVGPRVCVCLCVRLSVCPSVNKFCRKLWLLRGVSRGICDCFLEALVMVNGAKGAPLGGSGGIPPEVLKIDPQRCNLVHLETNS